MLIKIVHTSDVHLGVGINWLGEKAEIQKQQIIKTFEKVIDYSIEKKIDIFLVAGDLFDSYRPNSVMVAFVKTMFEKLTSNNIFIAIIPGNHDRLEKISVYKENKLFDPNFGFVFTKPGNNVFNIPIFDVNIFGYAVDKQFGKERPLDELNQFFKNYKKAKYNIGLVHGSLDINNNSKTNYPIDISDISQSEFDYIALGDWHSTLDVSNIKTAWYSGSPELVGRSQLDCGNILYIEIEEQKTKVHKVKIGKRIEKEIKIDIEKFGKEIEQSIIKELSIYSDPNLILTVELVGGRGVFDEYNLEGIKNLLSDKFFLLELRDCTKIKVNNEDLEKYPDTSLIGRYIKTIKKDIEETKNEEERQILEEALFEGIQRILSST